MIITSKFSPSWWLSNPHLQTIYASKLGTRPPVTGRRERLELPDGDFLDLHHSLLTQGPLVCLFHGLAGCLSSAYIRGVIHALETRGMRPVLMHWRGCSGEPNRLARSYHSGATEDIGTVIDLLRARHPREQIYAVGYSLGGNALLKYLGERGAACELDGAVAVCPPLVLEEGARRLNQGLARGYQRYLLGLMRGQHNAKRERHPELGLTAAGPELDNFWRFDDAITAPLHGYDGVHDYYQRCGARQYLAAIQVPCQVICAADDPFFTPKILPTADELGPYTTLERSAHGGHVGFITGGVPFRPRYWLDERVASVLSSMSDASESSDAPDYPVIPDSLGAPESGKTSSSPVSLNRPARHSSTTSS